MLDDFGVPHLKKLHQSFIQPPICPERVMELAVLRPVLGKALLLMRQ
jgi:hypothetical protein